MDLARREADRAAAAEFVALDIRGEGESPANDPELLMESSFVAAKEFERDRRGDVISSSSGAYEKQTVPVHVDDCPREHLQPSTPTAGGGAKRRRSSRRVLGWRDPRKILFAFAALSSVGTLILLYFTLSMGKMTGGQADGQ
ncbi:uncharacterized protein [Zea mays]|uniref:Uncharacterized protein n=1 Tax=Zea mays TaxID=4577 RepID=B6UEN3_MAIZE|nr:uncharacterized protein LOC100278859 [Zea mays]XP_035817300.1 uncharacterized protein LOC100278859 isoform X1 [Zea mays]ACG47816.1 hypothetical protein [Zea mays]|eukprot:NP_001145470.1 uncharacterized protein LOC100278859 [Zea mays]